MKKNLKLLSALALSFIIAGCDVNALPSDYNETYGAIDMEEVYDQIRNSQGEASLYNQVINKIAEIEITNAKRFDELCSRIDEKIEDVIESYEEVDYTKYDKNAPREDYVTVDEDRLYAYYLSQGYEISSKDTTSDCWKAKEVLKDGATVKNTYISKTLKNEVLNQMLNEQFIYERKANSLYKTKQLRQIEYVYIDFDSENEDATIDFIYETDAKLRKGEIYDFEQIENDWKAMKKDVIEANRNKVGTEEDADKNYEYYNQFTACGDSVEVCMNQKMYQVDETEYYSEPKIYTNTDAPTVASMTDAMFSSTIYNKTKKEYDSSKVLDVTAQNGTTYHYLKSQSDVELGTDSLINVDTSTGNYYFVRFVVVENGNPNETEYTGLDVKYEGQEVKYAIAQALATTASNYSNCALYYLNKYKVAINDDKFFEYVYDTYGYPEDEDKKGE